MGRGRAAVAAMSSPVRWLLRAILGACVAIFLALSLDVTHDGVVARFDLRVARWASVSVPHPLHTVVLGLTYLGDSRLLALLVVASAAVLLYRGRSVDAALLVAAATLTAIATTGLKVAFRRSRPPFLDLSLELHSFSYPSGHTSGAFAVYVLGAILLTRGRSTHARVAAIAGALATATLVAVTRVVIPAHYLSDVIAGAVLALAVAAVAMLARDAVGASS